MARENLKMAQHKMKGQYNWDTVERSFCVGYKFLVLFPLYIHRLEARFHGPYEMVKKTSKLNKVLKSLDRRKPTQMCHINMIKPYYKRGKNQLCTSDQCT